MDRRQLSVLVVTLTVAIASVNGQCTLDVFPTYDSARRYSEFPAGVQAIVPQYKFPCTGVVRQLTARVGTGATEDATGLELQIWRPEGNGSYNLLWRMMHPSIGETSHNGSTVTFSPQIAIPVTRGDVIGFYISTLDSGESPFHLLHDPNVQGVTVYRTSGEIDEPFCNFTICTDSNITRLNNTAPLISAIYESTTDIQLELVRLSQFRVMDRCTTTSFSTCSLTPTKIVGALQTPSPSSDTRESGRTERPSPRVTSPIPMSTILSFPTSSSPPSPSLVAPEEPSFVPSPGTVRLTSETIVSIVIGVFLFIVLIILVVLFVTCMCHKRTAVSLDNKAHLGSAELNAPALNEVALEVHEHFAMNTNDAYGANTTEIATTGNVAYMTAGDAIPATQNVAYGQVPPGTDECYDYVIN